LEIPSASIAAAITGSTAFFEPEILTEPLSGPLGDTRKESILEECRKSYCPAKNKTDLVFSIFPIMLGRKRKTGTQIARELTKDITGRIGKHGLPVRAICKICIVIFSFSIAFGIYGLVSRMNDVSKREQNIERLQNELQSLRKQLEKKTELVEELTNDPLAIEAVPRSHGMSKKGERIFYFPDD
jgi:cell division protein FtsB